MPQKIIKIREKEISPAIPLKPTAVVIIRMIGPTSTSELFIRRAFSILLNFNINSAAPISILPDRILSSAIVNTIFSKMINIMPPQKRIFFPH